MSVLQYLEWVARLYCECTDDYCKGPRAHAQFARGQLVAHGLTDGEVIETISVLFVACYPILDDARVQ